MNLQTKIILNKFYKYSDTIVKIKKITKNLNKIYVIDLTTKEEIFNNFITIDSINNIDNQIFNYYNNVNYFFKPGEKDTIIES